MVVVLVGLMGLVLLMGFVLVLGLEVTRGGGGGSLDLEGNVVALGLL